jgi:S-adenosylmethionine uptake transporter
MQATWMLAASLLFAAMSACVKFASPWFTPIELVGYRGLIGVIFLGLVAHSRGVSLRTSVPMMHVWRNVAGLTALVASFYAIAHLPLATAMTLQYTSGIWIAAFLLGGTLLLGDLHQVRRQGPLVLAVLVGFAGVVLMLQPTLAQSQLFAGLVGLIGGMLGALAYVQVAALGRLGEPESRTVFYFSLGGMLVGGIGMQFFEIHPLATVHALWLLPMGLFAALGQLCLTRAYTQGATIVVANLQYSTIVFGALFGLTLFGDRIPWIGWLGMAVIVASAMASTVLRARALPNPPAEEF